MLCVKGCVQGADRHGESQNTICHEEGSSQSESKDAAQATNSRNRVASETRGLHELTGGVTGAGGWEDLISINPKSMFSLLRTGSNPTLLPVSLVQITAPDLDQSPRPLSTIVFLRDIYSSFFGFIFGFLCYDSCTCLLLYRQVGPAHISLRVT